MPLFSKRPTFCNNNAITHRIAEYVLQHVLRFLLDFYDDGVLSSTILFIPAVSSSNSDGPNNGASNSGGITFMFHVASNSMGVL